MSQLHIVNGDDLAKCVRKIGVPGEIIVWREMLCEGPTVYKLDTEEFIKLRSDFLFNTYQVSPQDYKKQFVEELNKLSIINNYEEIVLWFEFDLFSHINMLAAISYLIENRKIFPFSLVCSKKLKGEKEFSPLSQLKAKHLKNHYEKRIKLDDDDLLIANLIWQIYNGENPKRLKREVKKKSNFEYLSNCLRAHIERFPNSRTGLNTLEKNILKLIKNNNINTYNQLIGYSLEYQGYYGLGDIQVKRMIRKLERFYKIEDDKVSLTTDGEEALEGTRNFYQELKNNECMGGVKMYDFLYDDESHQILKL